MKRRFILLSPVAIVLSACAAQPEQQAEPVAEDARSAESDVAAIKTIFRQYDDAIVAGDLEGYLALFVDDCVVLPPNAEILMSKDEYGSYAQPIFDQFGMEETIAVEETGVSREWAFARGSYVWRLTPKAGGETVEEVGKFISILRRQHDESWKISRNIWNSDNAPPERAAS